MTKKLSQVIKYLRRTKWLRLTIEVNCLDQAEWFIEGAFAVHNDMRSHSRAFMSFGKGMFNGGSMKQKINTTSSTEAEIVAVHDNMAAVLWTSYFLTKHGYSIKPSIIHQDNLSSILLETNGKASSGKHTSHMNVRYFFITDRMTKKELSVAWCPTEDMTGNFWTKPLQGSSFRRLRDLVMGVVPQELPRTAKTKLKKATTKVKNKK